MNYASRKFIIALIGMISCSFLVWNKSISDGVYSTVMVAAIAAYIAGNVMQKKV